jgi:hypothetical protein
MYRDDNRELPLVQTNQSLRTLIVRSKDSKCTFSYSYSYKNVDNGKTKQHKILLRFFSITTTRKE